ncbi:chymotrypsin B [Rhipicephalus sanguineus]|uniref:chymotrypsin B n=1 Tax=Rhipicephalus sanguineus TaxID=34632 RepID=UPI0020C580A4|nr:chymotrypsin B [Rhipicephalus sanguineus]
MRCSILVILVAAVAAQRSPWKLWNGMHLRIRGVASGELETPGFTRGQSTPNGFQGSVTIHAPNGSRIRLDFEDFDLETSAQCSADRLMLQENGVTRRTLCSNLRPPPYLSRSSAVTVSLTTDRMKNSRGFVIRFTATRDSSVCGRTSLFECDNLACIPRTRVCDGQFDCVDGSDEGRCRNTECGSPNVESDVEVSDRIIAGEEAVPHSWPWQASIQLKGFWPAAHFCGGALLRNDLVITAAHCVDGLHPNELVVKLGSHNVVHDDPGVQVRRVSTYALHSDYQSHDLTHDVAVLKLSPPVNYTAHVRPVCLPRLGQQLPVNTACYATGWGNTRGSGHSFLLKQARLVVRDFDQACGSILSVQPNLRKNYTVCAVDESNDAGPCHGDSGGPLVCRLNRSSNWTLVGMTSQGTAVTMTKALCGMGTGTVWSGVIPNRKWIKAALSIL